MRDWWRFRRRSTELDDLISAYVEGRTDAGGEARLRQHLAGEPETQAGVDSLRATVALLHSIAPAKAPRSFAFQEAPAPAPRPLIRYEWAPAMASAAAAVVVGLLVLGDVTGMLSQAGAPRPQARPVSTQVVEAPAILAALEIEVETVLEAETVIERAVEAWPAEAPARMEAPRAPPAVEALAGSAVPVEGAALDAAEKGATPPVEAFKAVAPGEAEEAVSEKALGAPVPRLAASPAPDTPAPGVAVGGGPVAEQPADEGGFSLPVRQLEIAFGAAAAVLAAGAWLLLRRRSRRDRRS